MKVRARAAGMLLLFLGLVLSAAPNAGCNKKTAGGTRATKVYVSPEWSDLGIRTLAYLGARSTVGGATALTDGDRIISGEVRGSQDKFVVLSAAMVADRAEKAGMNELLGRVIRVWRDDQLVDQFLARELTEGLGVDGLLLADLNDWTEYQIEATQEGTSWTRVGIGLYIYSGKNGLLVWGADRALRKESLPYRPSGGAAELAGSNTAASAGEREREERRENRLDSTPEPPPIDEVARAVMGELLVALPDPAPAS